MLNLFKTLNEKYPYVQVVLVLVPSKEAQKSVYAYRVENISKKPF